MLLALGIASAVQLGHSLMRLIQVNALSVPLENTLVPVDQVHA